MTWAADLDVELAPLAAMLGADGYALSAGYSPDGQTIVLEISATSSACAECLAPAGVIAAVARSCLPEGSGLAGCEIDVRMSQSIR